ncbi:MAG: FG-GAP-like repeat-containing protein [Deltaproteobacteria bacterium]|nr:FG-GAP-like repeat-containing protein [Deltaproteobacteria bacterium]
MTRNVVGIVLASVWAGLLGHGCTGPSRRCETVNLVYVESEGMCIGYCGPTNTSVLCVSADGGVVEAGTRDAGMDAEVTEASVDAGMCDEAQSQCTGMCIDTQHDPRHCGACGRSCPVVLGGTELCIAGMCDVRCNEGRHLCDSRCVEDTSVSACGASCTPCSAPPPGGIATCTAGACGFVCAMGFDRVGAGCALRVPRQLSPLSTSRVTSQTPTLRWEQPAGITETQVELCHDRAMTRACQTQRAMGNSARPPAALMAGLWYWRVRGVQAGTPGTMASAVWQLRVGARSATVDSSWGTEADFNGDGYADVVVGAPLSSPGGRSRAGTVSVFMGSATGVASTSSVVLQGVAAADGFGLSVASAGDVNGDGYGDLVVGATGADPGGRDAAGTASVYLGSATGLSAIPAQVLEGAAMTDGFGASVASAGDVNGDGYGDLVVGADGADPGGRGSAGTASVFMGSATGISATPARVLEGVGAGDYFGRAVASAGDVNGDGYGDLVVGAWRADRGGTPAGAASVFMGGATGISATPGIVLRGVAALDRFGYAVAGAGDVNGDGYADVLVGADGAAPRGRSLAGTASVFMGSAAGMQATPALVLEGASAGDRFASAVASAGDVNGDGYADVLVGGYLATVGGRSQAGIASVFAGGVSGLTATPVVTLQGMAADDAFGLSVASAGDVNGDGYGDLVVGATGADPGGRDAAGTASVFVGSAAGIAAAPAIVLEGPLAGDNFGLSVARLDAVCVFDPREQASVK